MLEYDEDYNGKIGLSSLLKLQEMRMGKPTFCDFEGNNNLISAIKRIEKEDKGDELALLVRGGYSVTMQQKNIGVESSLFGKDLLFYAEQDGDSRRIVVDGSLCSPRNLLNKVFNGIRMPVNGSLKVEVESDRLTFKSLGREVCLGAIESNHYGFHNVFYSVVRNGGKEEIPSGLLHSMKDCMDILYFTKESNGHKGNCSGVDVSVGRNDDGSFQINAQFPQVLPFKVSKNIKNTLLHGGNRSWVVYNEPSYLNNSLGRERLNSVNITVDSTIDMVEMFQLVRSLGGIQKELYNLSS